MSLLEVTDLAIAFGGLRLLVTLNPANLPRLDQIGLDFGVLGFASLIALGDFASVMPS